MAKQVKIYSTPSCPFCIKAKQFLSENGINFENIDVSTNQAAAEEMVQKSGQMGVPVIDIDGEIVVGFDRDRLKEALNL